MPWGTLNLGGASDSGDPQASLPESVYVPRRPPPRHPDIVLTCDEDVLVGMRAARQAASQALKELDQGDLDSKSARAALQSKISVLKSMDVGFAVELAVLQAIGAEGGEVLIQKMILGCLPGEGRDEVTIASAAESLLSTVASPLYKFLGEKARSFIDLSLDAIRAIQGGEAPPTAKLAECTGSFWPQFLNHLPWFASCGVKDGDAENIVFGPTSLTARVALCQAKATASQLKFNDLSDLHIFEYWLSASEKVVARCLTDDLLQAMAGAKKAPQAKATASRGARATVRSEPKRKVKAGLKAIAAAADDDAAILSFFG